MQLTHLPARLRARGALSLRRWNEARKSIARQHLEQRNEAARHEGLIPPSPRITASPGVALLGRGDGEWAISARDLPRHGIVLSFGIGTDLSFERDLVRRFNATVHAFDPTPIALEWVNTQKLPSTIQVHPWGIADYDGELELELPQQHGVSFVPVASGPGGPAARTVRCPVRRLETIARELAIPAIDILKLDIEGAEIDAIPDILDTRIPIRQLLVEYHHRWDPTNGPAKTQQSLRQIFDAGFELFYISERGLEFSFRRRG
jgi:FkbM family methyltransferase